MGLKSKRPTWCHLLFYFTSYVLNRFRTLIYPSSRAWDYSVELPHWSCSSWFGVCWNFGVVGLGWYRCWKMKLSFGLQHRYHSKPTTPKLQDTSKQEHTTNVVIQQNSRKILMMDILVSEICWVKWNKIASDIMLVYYASNITMMHSPINIKCMALLVQ